MTDTRALISLSLAGLKRMQLPSGLFCLETSRADPTPQGESLRYSAMTLIGLRRAAAHGYDVGFDLDAIEGALLARLGDPQLHPGDYGLFLWADAVGSGAAGGEVLAALRQALARSGGTRGLEGMEPAWILEGLARQSAERGLAGGEDVLAEALGTLLVRQSASGLLRHSGERGIRARFPNFASQIYGVRSLAVAGRLGVAPTGLEAARRLADRVVALQLPDGGWPWIFDAQRGRVVERYQVYSVHQHAMAPLALLELAEATGDGSYARAARAGLPWIEGGNELGTSLVDPELNLVYRSIWRRWGWNRVLWRYALTALAVAGPAHAPTGRLVAVNSVCRPYELGWLLEAWAGREDAGQRTS